MKEAIIFDVDDLLLDYTYSLGEFAKKYYGKTVVGRPTDYNLCEWLNSTQEEVETIIDAFNYNSIEFGEIPAVDSFVVARVRHLRVKYSDMKFIVVSKCGDKGTSNIARQLNLRNVFGKDVFDEIHLISPFDSKLPLYTELSMKYDVITVLDDHLKNISDATKLGLKTVVLRRSHNTDKIKPKHVVVDDWFDLSETIIKQVQHHRAEKS